MKTLILAGVGLAALTMPQAAIAQIAESDETLAEKNEAQQLNEPDNDFGAIIVTAQKRAENVQDIPIAISALGADYLDKRDVTSIADLGSVAPNLKIERAPSNKTISQISIRGSVTINPSILFEPAVGLYVDGVYIAKAQGSVFDVADLERVEVLRGPQGTLYGRNTLAGAINLVTKKPSGEFGGKLEATYGRFDDRRLRGTIDLPQVGIFSAKVSGQYRQRDGIIDVVETPGFGPVPYEDTNDIDTYSVMAQLRAEPTDRITLDYTYDYSDTDQRPDYAQLYSVNLNGNPADIFDPSNPFYSGIPLAAFANKERQGTASLDGTPLFEKAELSGHALTAEFDLGPATIKSITAYREVEFADSLDLDGSPLDVALTQRFTDYEQFSQELQLTGDALNDRLRYVLGVFYFEDDAYTNNPQSYFFNTTNFDSQYGGSTENYAAYAQVDFKVSDRLTATGGLRWNQEEKTISRTLRFLPSVFDAPGTPAFTAIDVAEGDVPKAKYDDLSPSFALRYELSNAIDVYGRYAAGFKSGGFNAETNLFGVPGSNCADGAIELCNPYRPETVDSFEVGVKSRLLDNRLTLNIAAFWDEKKDIQLSVFDGSGAAASTVVNAAEARIRGVEIEAYARPGDRLQVAGSFAYLDADYKSFIDSGIDVSDNRAFPQTPSYTANASVDWTAFESVGAQLNLVGDINFVSEYFTYPYAFDGDPGVVQLAGNTRSPGRTIVNARAILSQIALGGAEASITGWVQNLFGEDEPANFIDFGPGFGGLNVAYYPDPTTYGVTVGFDF